jgi:very-short-patch-repair endonuclease
VDDGLRRDDKVAFDWIRDEVMMAKADLRSLFVEAWEQHGFAASDLTPELKFHPTRRWRFDIAFPSLKVAVELDGFGFGHQSKGQRRKDNEKSNAAAELGWTLLRYTSAELVRSRIADTVEQVCRVLETKAAATRRKERER